MMLYKVIKPLSYLTSVLSFIDRSITTEWWLLIAGRPKSIFFIHVNLVARVAFCKKLLSPLRQSILGTVGETERYRKALQNISTALNTVCQYKLAEWLLNECKIYTVNASKLYVSHLEWAMAHFVKCKRMLYALRSNHASNPFSILSISSWNIIC